MAIKNDTKKDMVKSTQPNKETDNVKSAKEIELESKLLKMEEMLRQLIQEKESQSNNNEPKQAEPMQAEPIHQKVATNAEELDEIPFKTFIKVMSLTNHTLTLATEGMGRGKLYNFVDFGQMQNIMYEDVENIVHNNRSFAEDCKFVILHPTVPRLLSLEKSYEKLLDKKTIEEILLINDKNKIKDIFSNTTKSIQETIVSIITEKIINDESVDLNNIAVISDLYGKDIYTMAKEAKSRNAV